MDMNKCRVGDKLVLRNGKTAIYLQKRTTFNEYILLNDRHSGGFGGEAIFPHALRIDDGKYLVTVTDEGLCYVDSQSPSDVVGVVEDSVNEIKKIEVYQTASGSVYLSKDDAIFEQIRSEHPRLMSNEIQNIIKRYKELSA